MSQIKKFGDFTHQWELDLPWHMVDLRDWFYMVNVGFIEPIVFLHVRVCGIRSLWCYHGLLVRDAQLRIGADDARQPCPACGDKGHYPVNGHEATCEWCQDVGQC
jgi:hypothetical protein